MANDYLNPALVGALGGVLVAGGAKLVDYLLARKKITLDDDTSLRKDLMAERASLIEELGVMGTRCSNCENENGRLHTELIALQQEHNKAANILERRVWELELEVETMKKEIHDFGIQHKNPSGGVHPPP